MLLLSNKETIAIFANMKRKIITYGGYFEAFIATLSEKELRKLDYVISLLETEDRLPLRFIKFLREGLYELRMGLSNREWACSYASLTHSD